MDDALAPTATIPAHVPPGLVVDFDYIADPGLARDPQAVYQRLASGPEIVWTPRNGGHWIATRHEVIAEIFHAPELFSNFPRVIPRSISGFGGKPQPFSDIDPPHNAPYRRLLQQVLNPRAVQVFEDQARALMVELAEEIRPLGGCDFAVDVAQKLPIFIMMRWMDLPFEDRFQLLAWVDQVMSDPVPDNRRRAKDAIAAYVDGVVRTRRETPGEDVISHLANGDLGERIVTQEEARAMAANLINGGLDTVRNMMSFTALFLARHPGHRRQLVEDPALIPAAVEELLRWFAIPNMGRSVARDTTFRGVALKAGDLMLLPLSLAGRDPSAYAGAGEVDFRRDKARHLSFGSGAHLCPGMYLAKIELRVFLEEWLKRIPEFAIAPGQAPVTRGGVILAVNSLPLSWT